MRDNLSEIRQKQRSEETEPKQNRNLCLMG